MIFVEPYRLSKMICTYVNVVIKQKIPCPDHVQIDKNGHPQLNTVLEISNQFCIAFSFCMHITLLAKKVVTARDDVYFL